MTLNSLKMLLECMSYFAGVISNFLQSNELLKRLQIVCPKNLICSQPVSAAFIKFEPAQISHESRQEVMSLSEGL